tara:strand:- start:128 stop:865 length:738 start_codon:yes stop_codon:yes gene_type:complete
MKLIVFICLLAVLPLQIFAQSISEFTKTLGDGKYVEAMEMLDSLPPSANKSIIWSLIHHQGLGVPKDFRKALEFALASVEDDRPASPLVSELIIENLLLQQDIYKLQQLSSHLETTCSVDWDCIFHGVWDFIDITGDDNISLAELAKFQRGLVKLTYAENVEYKVEQASAMVIGSILVLPIAASSILNSFDYDNDGLLQKDEVIGDNEFAAMVGIDSGAIFESFQFKDMGQSLLKSMNFLPFLKK